MTIRGALAAQLYVSGYDLGDDIRMFSTRCPVATFDQTPITKLAMKRGFGQRDGGMAVTAFFNPAISRAHKRFSLLPTADQQITVTLGTSIGQPSFTVLGKQLNYDGNRDQAGELTFASDFPANGYGLEIGHQLTAGVRTDTGATNGASYDQGSASPGAFGGQFHLHVLAFTGTDVTIKLQESSDNGAGDAFADVVGGSFGAITSAPTFARIATAAINIERHLRVVTTTSGGFSSVSFLVVGVRNDAAVVI